MLTRGHGVALAALAGIVVACGGDAPLAARVASWLQERTGAHARVVCPSGVDEGDGAAFDCRAALAGTTITVHVAVGAAGKVSVTPVGLAARAADVDDLVATAASDPLGGAPDDVDCGDDAVVVNPGDPFDCEVVVDGVEGTIEVVVDADGRVTNVTPK